MTVTLEVRFPLGRYHATPWNHAVNEGAVEWPPSPWRLLRALVSTWHLRWPELPAAELDPIVEQLVSTPPRYWTPPVSPGQTRHYLPDLADTTGERNTDLVLDPFLWIDGDRPLLIQWDVELDGPQRGALAKLCELWPYLGRSDSVAHVSLLADDPVPDDTWWEISSSAVRPVDLLTPDGNARRPDLEVTTGEVRKRHLTSPRRAHYQPYARETDPVQAERPISLPEVEAVRWRLVTRAPFGARYGVLATDQLRHTRLDAASRAGDLPSVLTGKQSGSSGVKAASVDDHTHAHWLWLSVGDLVTDLVLWVPAGFSSVLAGAMVSRSSLPGRARRTSDAAKGQADWSPEGFRPGDVHMVAAGPIEVVTPELVGPADDWVSHTPYLPVRRRKRNQTLVDWARLDIEKECDYRGLPRPVSVQLHPDEGNRIRHYRRYRWSENMAQRRPGVWVSMTFNEAIARQPLCLGQLSHFGFGLFAPRER